MLATDTTGCLAPQVMGNGEDGSAAGARHTNTLEPGSKPPSSYNILRWDQRISPETDKPNSRSLNEEKVN